MTTKKTGKRHIWKWLLAGLVVLVLAVDCGASAYLLNYAIGRSGGGAQRNAALTVDEAAVAQKAATRDENSAKQASLTEAFLANTPEEVVSITSNDGLKLVGSFYAQENSHRYALIAHGYRSNRKAMSAYAQRYYDAGYQVLMPDLRACGESEGDYVGMGWLDRLDMLKWIDWICAKDPAAKIVMHGTSMGGATVMMTSGENVPANVVAYVEDCGYTSVWDIFASEMQVRFSLPTFPLLNTFSLFSKVAAGYDPVEASSVKQVAKCDRPMLFIHGDQDDFVPFSHMQPLYEANPCESKVMLAVEGAGHGKSKDVLGDAYWEQVFAFVAPYVAEN